LEDKFELDATIDFIGYADYWSGHGHAFSDSVACIRFGFPVDYTETVKEILQNILDNINGFMSPFDILDETVDKEELHEFVTDERIEESVRALFREGAQDTDNFFDNPELSKELDQEEDTESPQLIGWIHVDRI